MATATLVKRKIIDIPEDTFRHLSNKAAAQGVNLKLYIENILVQSVLDMDDSEVFTHLLKTRPEGKQILNKQEQESLNAFLGIEK
jgi:hypothetical protein